MFDALNPMLVQGVLLVVVLALMFAATAAAAYIANNERLRGLWHRWQMIDDLLYDLITTAAGIDEDLSAYEKGAEEANLDVRMYFVITRGVELATSQIGLNIDFWDVYNRANRIYHELVADEDSPVS